MKRLVLALLLAPWALVALALPTVEDVRAEVAKGNVAQAEEMMRSVVQAKPGSARAHYVYAELLARDRRYEQAAEQAALAKSIDPSMQFTQPEQFKAFEQLLERERTAVKRSARTAGGALPALPQPAAVGGSSQGGVPGWLWMLGLGAAALVAWRALSGRWQAVASPAAGASGMAGGHAGAAGMPQAGAPMGGHGPGYSPGYGPAGYPPNAAGAAGRNWLGTGLAAAGGVAAGMMAERMLHGHQDQGLASSPEAPDAPGLRGMAPGLLGEATENDAQRDLDQRPVDFGTGDEWGAGDAGSDDGPSGSDDGW